MIAKEICCSVGTGNGDFGKLHWVYPIYVVVITAVRYLIQGQAYDAHFRPVDRTELMEMGSTRLNAGRKEGGVREKPWGCQRQTPVGILPVSL